MTTHLTLEVLLRIAARAVGDDQELLVRDYGLLESAVARPATSLFGEDAYPSIELKAAALLHSLVNNHALVDGNKRLAWLATVVFLHLNDRVVDAPDDDAFDLVMAIASGTITELQATAERLHTWFTLDR